MQKSGGKEAWADSSLLCPPENLLFVTCRFPGLPPPQPQYHHSDPLNQRLQGTAQESVFTQCPGHSDQQVWEVLSLAHRLQGMHWGLS